MKHKSQTQAFGTPKRESHNAQSFYNRKITQDKHVAKPSKPIQNIWNKPDRVNVVYPCDSQHMHHLPDHSIHLMITSPPYNVGKEYDEDLTIEEYRCLLENVLRETYRVLINGGRACVNIANIGRTPYLPLHFHVMDIAQAIGFLMRGEIIWNKGASAGSSCAWGSWKSANNPVLRDVHEYILVFCKDTYKRHSTHKSTIERDTFLTNTKSVWTFPTVSAKKVHHPAPFPIELPRRLIQLYSFAGDLVLDPFMGSGTTINAAIEEQRHYIGYEINKDYVTEWEDRKQKQDSQQEFQQKPSK